MREPAVDVSQVTPRIVHGVNHTGVHHTQESEAQR